VTVWPSEEVQDKEKWERGKKENQVIVVIFP
jgi:hypothetical protein